MTKLAVIWPSFNFEKRETFSMQSKAVVSIKRGFILNMMQKLAEINFTRPR